MTSLAKSLALGACALLATALPAAAETVRFTVDGVRSGAGVVLAQLCTEPAAFPYDGCPHRLAIPAREGSVDVVFADVAPGVYAFSVFIDEDQDYFLDLDSEGAAFSNDATTVDFSKAAFPVEGDTKHKVRLYYGPK